VSAYPQQIPTNHQVRTSFGRLADTPGRFTSDINDDIKLIVVCAYTRSGRVLFNHIIRRHAVVKTPLLAFEHPIAVRLVLLSRSPRFSRRAIPKRRGTIGCCEDDGLLTGTASGIAQDIKPGLLGLHS